MKVKDETTPEVEKPNETTKKSTKKDKQSKRILVDLVDESKVDKLSIIMDLSQKKLLEQYHEEKELKKLGMPIKPSITEADFKKIIGDKE